MYSTNIISGDQSDTNNSDTTPLVDADEEWSGVEEEESTSDDEDFGDEIEQLRKWAIASQLPQQKIDELLMVLRKRAFPQLPKTAKTFLETATAVYVIEKLPDLSEFVYFSIEDQLKRVVKTSLHPDKKLELLFNVDGIPLFKSSSKQFWPILGLVYHRKVFYKPFPIAIYCGKYAKPSDVNHYFNQFVIEMNKLQSEGVILKQSVYNVSVKGFICDRPARAFIKQIKNHGAYFACERCIVRGQRAENRTVYVELNCSLRTHESFLTQENAEHHSGTSPLVNLKNIDMVNMFVLDFMHLGCLGVMKKLFEFWLDRKSVRKMSHGNRSLLSENLISLKSQIPVEFQRTTRDICEIQKWKATEYRFFLLYAGPIILKYCLSKELFEHFLLLNVACRILSSELAITSNEHAKSYLKTFVSTSCDLYGPKSIALNMHSLIHLADDATYFNDTISNLTAFPFESSLGQIKKLLRSGKHPLAQVCRRLHEIALAQSKPKITRNFQILKRKVSGTKEQITKIRFAGVILSVKEPDNTVLLRNRKIAQLKEMCLSKNKKNIEIMCLILKKERPLLNYPCNSNELQMWKVSRRKITHFNKCNLNNIHRKMVLFKFKTQVGEKMYTMPLLHM